MPLSLCSYNEANQRRATSFNIRNREESAQILATNDECSTFKGMHAESNLVFLQLAFETAWLFYRDTTVMATTKRSRHAMAVHFHRETWDSTYVLLSFILLFSCSISLTSRSNSCLPSSSVALFFPLLLALFVSRSSPHNLHSVPLVLFSKRQCIQTQPPRASISPAAKSAYKNVFGLFLFLFRNETGKLNLF